MSYQLQNESEVREYLEKLAIEYRFGCYSEKKPEVCHLLGDYLEGIKKDFEKASKVYKSNCNDYDYAKSCYKIGAYNFLGKGQRNSKGDLKQAYHYFEKGCNLDDPESCLHAGLILMSKVISKEVERNVPKGVDFLEKSCQMKNALACFYLSGMHISGVNEKNNLDSKNDSNRNSSSSSTNYIIPKDMKKAFSFSQRACELGNMYACANLSQMYAKGDGVEKSEANAEKFKKLSLEMQDEVKKAQPALSFQQGINS
ncbi:COA7 family protein [Megaselia abdita]